jgi:hypothetical protein
MKKQTSKYVSMFNMKALGLSGLSLLSVVYVFGAACLLNHGYMTNDSALLLEYVKQGLPIPYTGLLFIKLLHLAYRTAPGVPWYGLSLYMTHALCVFLWLWFICRLFRPLWLTGIITLAFLGYYLTFIIYLDYTSTAVMLCASSLTWIFLEVIDHHSSYLRLLVGSSGVLCICPAHRTAGGAMAPAEWASEGGGAEICTHLHDLLRPIGDRSHHRCHLPAL